MLAEDDEHRTLLAPGKKRKATRFEAPAGPRNSIYALGGDDAADEPAAAVIGTANARTLDAPVKLCSYLLAGNGKQLRALERGSGARMSVHMEHRDVNDRAPLRLTIWGDDTALTEAERQLKEAALASMRFAEKVIVARQAGAVIGKGGAHIKRIQEHTGTYVSVASRADNSDAPRSVVIRGAPECVEMAARLVFAAMRGRNEFEAAMAEDVVSAPNFFYCAHRSL